MADPIVFDTVLDAGSAPVPNAPVTIFLVSTISAREGNPGYITTRQSTVMKAILLTSDGTGHWSTPIVANSLIDPSGTYYIVSETFDPGQPPNQFTIVVPNDGGSHWVRDVIATPTPNPLPIIAGGVNVMNASTWLVGTTYHANDAVLYGDHFWEAVATSTGVTPGTDVTKWVEIGIETISGAQAKVDAGLAIGSLPATANDPTIDTAAVASGLVVPAVGGTLKAMASVWQINATLLAPSNFRWSGVPASPHNNGLYTNGSCLSWHGATNLPIVSMMGSSMCVLDGINVNGRSVGGCTGVLFDSINSPLAKYQRLENFQIAQVGSVGSPGFAIRVGQDAVHSYQADTWKIAHGGIYHCYGGVSINSANAGYQGELQHLGMNAHVKGIQVISAGNFVIDDINFGGHGSDATLIADIIFEDDGAGHGGTGYQITIKDCQTQNGVAGSGSAGYFLLVDSSTTPDLSFVITLMNNRVNDVGIQINQTKRLNLAAGNVFTNANVVLGAGSPRVEDHGSTFNGIGVRTVADAATYSGSNILTSVLASLVSTDVGKRVVASGSGPLPWAVMSGSTMVLQHNTTITAIYTGSTAPAWAGTQAYTLGQIVTTGTKIAQVTTAGTSSGSTPSWPSSGTIVDGTVTWTVLAAGTTAAQMSTSALSTQTGLSTQFDYGFVVSVGQVSRMDGTLVEMINSTNLTTNQGTVQIVCDSIAGGGGIAFLQANAKHPLVMFAGAKDRAISIDSTGAKIDNLSHVRSIAGVPAASGVLGDVTIRGDSNADFYFNMGGTTYAAERDLVGNRRPPDNNYSAWTYDEILAVGNQGTLAAGVLFVVRLPLVVSGTLGSVFYAVSTIGVSATAGQCFVAIFDSLGNQLGITADQATNFVNTGRKAVALTSPTSSLLMGAPVYAAFLFNGTTGPQLRGVGNSHGGNNGGSASLTASQLRFATYGSGLTAMPATITIASLVGSGSTPWCAVSA